MKRDNVLKTKSFDFAKRILKLHSVLINEKKEYVISKQLLRSGTSIGANVREAVNAESKKDFVHKLGVAQKECDETLFWIELLKDDYLTIKEFESIHIDAFELLKIIRSIILTTKEKLNKTIE